MTMTAQPPLQNFQSWPEDFGARLEKLKLLSGLTWRQMARALGVTDRAILLWRRDKRRPSGARMWAVVEFACQVPGGIEVLLFGTSTGWDWRSQVGYGQGG